jgi:glycerol-3-phosphate dehydrogenase subunit C
VAIFATCFVNYNEPGIGLDLVKVLDHNAIPWVQVRRKAAAACPSSNWATCRPWRSTRTPTSRCWPSYAAEGYAILSPMPSCTLMFKQELPLMFPDDADVQAVKAAMFDPFEYLVARQKDGLLKTDFKRDLGKVSYHIPCHGRVQNIGKKTEEMFKLIGQTVAVQAQHRRALQRPCRHLWREDRPPPGGHEDRQAGVQGHGQGHAPDFISSDCALAGHHIAQGMQQAGTPAKALQHPLSLLRHAYGID